MSRLLLIGLLLIILRLAVKNFTGQLKASVFGPEPGRPNPRPPQPPQVVAETLVQCSKCGTYVASSRALTGAGAGAEVFCSEECRRGA